MNIVDGYGVMYLKQYLHRRGELSLRAYTKNLRISDVIKGALGCKGSNESGPLGLILFRKVFRKKIRSAIIIM